MSRYPDIDRGDDITATWLNNRTTEGVIEIRTGPGLRIQRSGQSLVISIDPASWPITATFLPQRMKVTALANDYVEAKRYDGTSVSGDAIKIAKPPKMRHSTGSNYPGITTIATTDTNTVTMSKASETDEIVYVSPLGYSVDMEVYAVRVAGGTGVADCDWMHLNIDGMAWAWPEPDA